MRTRHRLGASLALLAAVLASAPTAPLYSARAADASSLAESEESRTDLSRERLLDEYFSTYHGGEALARAIRTSRIKKYLFAHVGDEEYSRILREIDRRAEQDPEAGYDLAKTLQLHWEAQYGVKLEATRFKRAHISTEAGAMIGMAALGAALLIRPQAAPAYFRIFRHLMPVAGVIAGHAIGSGLNQAGWLDRDIPMAPAHFMRLGVPSEKFDYGDEELTRDLLSLTTSIAAGSIAYDALRLVTAVGWISRATTPLKLNLAYLAGSIIVTFAAEKGVEAAVDHHELKVRHEALRSAVSRLERAQASGDDSGEYAAGDELVAASLSYSRYLNRPTLDAIRDYSEEVSKASRKLGVGTPRFQSKLDELTRDLNEKIASLRRKSKSGSYYSSWVENYLPRQSDTVDSQLASQLRSDHVPNDPDYVLVQASALLRSSHREYLSPAVDLLIAQIQRDLLITHPGTEESPREFQ